MSRNFEILHRSAAKADVFRLPATLRSAAATQNRPQRTHGGVEDEVAKFVHRLFLCSADAKPPTLVCFCGVDAGAGCSWVCARASEFLAEHSPGRVCVVDANLRAPSMNQQFRLSHDPQSGFTDAMKDDGPVDEFVSATWSSHLWVMTSGAVGKEPNGALNPERLRARLSELRGAFDYVLVDTPPVNSYPDATLLGRLADGVVLVVESNATRRESARAAKEALDAAKVQILGAVLNRRTYPIPEALYRRL